MTTTRACVLGDSLGEVLPGLALAAAIFIAGLGIRDGNATS